MTIQRRREEEKSRRLAAMYEEWRLINPGNEQPNRAMVTCIILDKRQDFSFTSTGHHCEFCLGCFFDTFSRLLTSHQASSTTRLQPILHQVRKKTPCSCFSKQGRGTLITSMYPHLFSTRDEEPPALCDEGTLYALAARS
jgi:hypothetical protein